MQEQTHYGQLKQLCDAAVLRLEDVDLIMSLLGAARAASLATDARLDATNARLDDTDARLFGLGPDLEQLRQNMENLYKRQEFIRTETLFELRAALDKNAGAQSPDWKSSNPDAKIVAPQRLDTLKRQGPLRVNVGCGHLAMPEYVNVDMRELPHVDVVSDASRLPFPEGSVIEVFSSHLLEHFPREHVRRVLLPHWVSRLGHGGKLVTIVPDPEAMFSDYQNNSTSWEDLREVLYGLQEYAGDFHFTMFSRDELEVVMREVGLDHLKWEFQGRKNGKCRDMSLVAVKP